MYTTRVILWYPPKKGVQYPLIDNLLYQVTFFSHLTVLSSHCAIPTSHVTVFFLTFGDSFFFFSHLTVPFSHCAVLTSHVTIFLSHLVFPYYFFLIFDNFIITLCRTNITCDSSFVTFSDSFTFFSHFTIPSSHCVVLTSHITVLFSHLVVPLLFSHI